MKFSVEDVRNRTPKFVHGYRCSDADVLSMDSRFCAPTFVVKSVACLCGSQLMFLEVVQKKHLRGVCVKSAVVECQPPVYTVCALCKRSRSLFDPVMHGWKGEAGLVQDEGAQRLVKYNLNPGEIFVAYSYRPTSNYDKLLSQGILDLENYFDSLSVLYRLGNDSAISEVLTTECI